MESQNERAASIVDEIDEIEELAFLQPELAGVEFRNLFPGRIIYKDEYRQTGCIPELRQLVMRDHGLIEMEATANTPIRNIYGWVKREERAASIMGDKNGEVPINLIRGAEMVLPMEDGFLLPFSVDLHGIYEGNVPNKPVFELSEEDANVNKFQLVIQLEFYNGFWSEKFISPTFTLQIMKSAQVEFQNLYDGKIFYKDQYRRKGDKSRQLVMGGDHGLIKMEAMVNVPIRKIYGWVKRKESAALGLGDGEVPSKNKGNEQIFNLLENAKAIRTEDGFKQPFSVDLHGIYEGNTPNKPVFELSKSDASLNKFQLVIQLEFYDSSWSEKFISPEFTLQTKGKQQVKRPRRDDTPSTSRSAHFVDENETISDNRNLNEVEFKQKILVDTLDAKTAKVEKLVAKNLQVTGELHVETQQADLAYHLTLNDPDQFDLDEGDIVGLFNDEESGETYIRRLRDNNIHSAIHAGVISRSHWLAGHKPQNPDTKTDTVCVIGIVNVKVVGDVENGERIYASWNNPGKAVAQSYMPVGSFLRKKHVLLGMALETKKCAKSFDEVQLVKCFVCIVLNASRDDLLEEINELYEVNEKRTREQIRISNKKSWKKLKDYSIAALLFIGMAICILYQLLVPGSMFRYWLCRRGSIPYHELFYDYKNEALRRDFHIDGIEFTWEGLQDKVGFSFSRNTMVRDGSNVSYYLNVDRCAYYWAEGATGNNIGGHKYIGGSRILSVNYNCSVVYSLDEGEDVWNVVLDQTHVNCTTGP